MSKHTSRVSIDTYVRNDRPNTNYEQSVRIHMKGEEWFGYVYFPRPFPLGATIKSAVMRVKTWSIPQTGTHTLSVKQTKDRIVMSRMTWKTRPQALTAGTVSVSKSGPLPDGEEWLVDITEFMQSVADGGDWWGFRTSFNGTERRTIYGSGSLRGAPVVDIEWEDAPDTPDNLVPNGNLAVGEPKPVLRFDYIDVSGDTTLEAVQVQVNDTFLWTTPIFDSGEFLTSVPEFDLEASSYAGIPLNGSVWWRVRVKDGAGLWSDWSDAAQMRYVPRPTLTVTSPTTHFYDTTQLVEWNLSGVQTAYRVTVISASDRSRFLYDSGKITGNDESLTIPKGAIRRDDEQYRFTVRVWDDVKRVTTPGSPTWSQQVVWTWLDTDTTQPEVTDFTATWEAPRPIVTLSWLYNESLPDGWAIWRNTEIVARLDDHEVEQVNGRYVWRDQHALPHQQNMYTVRPVNNGKIAWSGVTRYVTPKPWGIWLLSDEDEVCLMGTDTGTFEMGEQSTAHEVLGASRVTMVNQGLRGYEGEISGSLVSGIPGMEDISAQEWRDKLLGMKSQAAKGQIFRLVVSDMNIPVKIGNVVPRPLPEAELMFEASFSFWQHGELPFDA